MFRANGNMMSLADWRQLTAQDGTSLEADPLILNDPRANDYYTQPGSPARDIAIPTGSSYCGAGPDVGFLESCF
jgi:hypothetical protein